MKNNLRLSLVQADLIWENRTANLKQLELQLDKLSPCDIIILPEMFDSGFTMNVENCAQHMEGPSIKWMKSMAKKHNAAITGSLIINEGQGYYNRFVFIDPDSNDLRFYDKRHLFSIAEEHQFYKQGSDTCRFDFRNWNISLFICYDLRFPMWSSLCAGSELMIYVANWPEKRKRAWNSLLQARAIENQCYVAGVNRSGSDPKGNVYPGNSQIVNYEGEILTFMDQNIGQTTVEIEHYPMQVFRRAFPFIRDNDSYQII